MWSSVDLCTIMLLHSSSSPRLWFEVATNSLSLCKLHIPMCKPNHHCDYSSVIQWWPTSGTNNTIMLRPSGTRDNCYKSWTVPDIPGQLEPMSLAALVQHKWILDFKILDAQNYKFVCKYLYDFQILPKFHLLVKKNKSHQI